MRCREHGQERCRLEGPVLFFLSYPILVHFFLVDPLKLIIFAAIIGSVNASRVVLRGTDPRRRDGEWRLFCLSTAWLRTKQ
jgi:hypothetical protein